uniref:Uncharacterized protein n=1 Tax=Entomoneis paludosa TaxID=265537 RepID=A0A7S2Y8X2_9STRA|mmetsp:Transcript_22788/g.47548  ORF Transcript_22788/g.47548 Transcript_22788/m.47548 type:complete len:129 (+) Transcript_22788:191-577(+)
MVFSRFMGRLRRKKREDEDSLPVMIKAVKSDDATYATNSSVSSSKDIPTVVTECAGSSEEDTTTLANTRGESTIDGETANTSAMLKTMECHSRPSHMDETLSLEDHSVTTSVQFADSDPDYYCCGFYI